MAYRVTEVSVGSYPAFPSLPHYRAAIRRFISVALSLKSPSPGVTRHPVLRSSDFPRGQMPARSLVLLNNSIIMQTQCCVKNKMSFILRKHSCGISIYNTKAYMVRIRPQFSHSTMLVFPATLLTTADFGVARGGCEMRKSIQKNKKRHPPFKANTVFELSKP